VVTEPNVHFHLVVQKMVDATNERLLKEMGKDQAKAEGSRGLKCVVRIASTNHGECNDALSGHFD